MTRTKLRCYICGSDFSTTEHKWRIAVHLPRSAPSIGRERGWEWQTVCRGCRDRAPDPSGVQDVNGDG